MALHILFVYISVDSLLLLPLPQEGRFQLLPPPKLLGSTQLISMVAKRINFQFRCLLRSDIQFRFAPIMFKNSFSKTKTAKSKLDADRINKRDEWDLDAKI